MSKFTEQLRESLRICNDYQFICSKEEPTPPSSTDYTRQVYIYYVPYSSMSAGSQGWHVYSPYFNTAPDSAWYNHGKKVFYVLDKDDKKEQFEAAKKWATKKYKIKEWIRSPFGAYMDKEFTKKRIKELKQLLKENQGEPNA